MDVPPLAVGQCKPLKYKELPNTRNVAQFRQYFKGAHLNRQEAYLIAGLIVLTGLRISGVVFNIFQKKNLFIYFPVINIVH